MLKLKTRTNTLIYRLPCSPHDPTVEVVNTLSQCHAAYLAGLVDADGTITLTRKHINENRHPALSISNTDRHLLEFVLDIVGAGKITTKRTSQNNHAQSYAYAVYNRQALQLIEQLVPFLKAYKMTCAELIIRDYLCLTPRNGRYSHTLKLARNAFEKRVMVIKPSKPKASP